MWGTGIHLGHDLPFRTLSQPSPAVPSLTQPCPVQPSHVQSSKLLAAGGTASAEEGGKDWDRGKGRDRVGGRSRKNSKAQGTEGRSALLDWVKQDEFLLPLGGSRPQHV